MSLERNVHLLPNVMPTLRRTVNPYHEFIVLMVVSNRLRYVTNLYGKPYSAPSGRFKNYNFGYECFMRSLLEIDTLTQRHSLLCVKTLDVSDTPT